MIKFSILYIPCLFVFYKYFIQLPTT
jgi:hypothetical protein